MKLFGCTTSYNVEKIIPIVVPYIKILGYDKFIVYDNMSTDRTVEMLKEYPFIEVVPWDTGGKYDEDAKRELEINLFAKCRDEASNGESVWMTFTDFDEVIFWGYDLNFKSFLSKCETRGENCFWKEMAQVMLPIGYNTDDVMDFIKEGFLPHSYPGCVVNHQYSKPVLFHVNPFKNLYFLWGNHYALCDREESAGEIKNIKSIPLYLLHFKHYFPEYGCAKNKEYFYERHDTVYKDIVDEDDIIPRLYGASYPMSLYLANDARTIDINTMYNRGIGFWGMLGEMEDWKKSGFFKPDQK